MNNLYEEYKRSQEWELTKNKISKRMSDHYYDQASFEEGNRASHIVANSKITSRYWERWLAHKGGATTSFQSENGEDGGDIMLLGGIYGKHNMELKTSEKGFGIGGGQFRFWENVPYYVFFKIWKIDTYEIFLLKKNQLLDEVRVVGHSFTSSQGSGQFDNFTREQMLQVLDDNVLNKRQDKIGIGFNTKGKQNLANNPKSGPNVGSGEENYKRWQGKYLITLDQLKIMSESSKNEI